jgi:hypothetical protein
LVYSGLIIAGVIPGIAVSTPAIMATISTVSGVSGVIPPQILAWGRKLVPGLSQYRLGQARKGFELPDSDYIDAPVYGPETKNSVLYTLAAQIESTLGIIVGAALLAKAVQWGMEYVKISGNDKILGKLEKAIESYVKSEADVDLKDNADKTSKPSKQTQR